MNPEKQLLEHEIFPTISIAEAHFNSIQSIAAHPDGKELATGSHDHLIKLWDVQKGTNTGKLQAHNQGIWSLEYSPDGRQLLSGSCDSNLIIWDVRKSKPIKTLSGHKNKIYWAKYNQKGSLVASVGQQSPVIIWDMKTGGILKKIPSKSKVTYCIQWSKNGEFLATTQMDGTLNIYDTKNFDLFATSPGNLISEDRSYGCDLDFVHMNGRIFVATEQRYIKQFELLKKDSLIQKKKYFAHFDAVKSLTLDGKRKRLLSTGRDGSLRMWDVTQNAKPIASLVGHDDNVSKAVFVPNNNFCVVASGAWDQKLNIWKLNF